MSNSTIEWSAPLDATAGNIGPGDCLVLSASGAGYVLATDANMAARAGAVCEGVATTYGAPPGSVGMCVRGPIDVGVNATGTRSIVRRSSAGKLERAVNDGVSTIMGRADGSGRVVVGLATL